jgi:hypothetical protein
MVKDLEKFYQRYKTQVWLAAGALILWYFRGFFGDAAAVITSPLAGIAEKSKLSAEEAHDKLAVKNVNPAADTASVAVFKEDARGIAAALGYLPGVYSNMLLADRPAAFGILKKYTKYIMVSGKVKVVNGVKQVRKKSLQLPVLKNLYKEATNGRVLLTDLDKFFNFDDEMGRYYKAYIRQ